MSNQKVKWTRTADGYQSKDERFTITKHTGRAYTRGPFRNWWDVRDAETGRGHNSLPSLVEAKAWAENAASTATVQQDECCGRPIHDGDPEGYVLACCGNVTSKSTGGEQ